MHCAFGSLIMAFSNLESLQVPIQSQSHNSSLKSNEVDFVEEKSYF